MKLTEFLPRLPLFLAVLGMPLISVAGSETANQVKLGKTVYSLASGDFVIGQDKHVYQFMGPMEGGKFAMKLVPVVGWLGSNDSAKPDEVKRPDEQPVVGKDQSFVAEVEIKDCESLCSGNKVYQKGGAQLATVERVFSSGTLLVQKSTTNSIGIITGYVPMLTMAQDVVQQGSFIVNQRNHGVASGPR